jgi:hypothetical protein
MSFSVFMALILPLFPVGSRVMRHPEASSKLLDTAAILTEFHD